MGVISSKLDTEFCNILNGWHTLEKTLSDGSMIVDVNIPRYTVGHNFKRREEVLYELDQIIASDESKQDRMFFHRAFGLRAFLIDVMNKRTTPIDEYLPATMGFKSTLLPEEYVIAVVEQARESLAHVGVTLENALAGMAEKSRLVPAQEIPGWFKSKFGEAVSKAEIIFPVPPNLPEPDVSVTSFGESSMVKANITGFGNRLSVTFNERTVVEESEERLEGTLNHEILGHGIQIARWHDFIEAGTWPKYRGMTSVQSIEAFHMEALAEYASVYYAGKSDVQKAINDLAFAGRIVNNNFNDMALRKSASDAEVKNYYTKHLPFRDEEFAQKRLDFVRDTSLRRAYTSVYGPGNRLTTHIMESIDEPKQREFMRAMYEGYMDPTDIQELGMKMGAKKLAHFEPFRPKEVQAVEDALRPSNI